ncbi:MAG: hypothetical protein U9Q74_02725 [Gemmatimonadota bacterium]|nr:hypothetical protein [Gemmatimonadota bacterium]
MPSRFQATPRSIAATCGALLLLAAQAAAQEGAPKTRLELADSARAARGGAAPASVASTGSRAVPSAPAKAGVTRTRPGGATPGAAAGSAGRRQPPAPTAGELRADFVRNQAILGLGIYAPAFATTVATNGVAWGASYLLVAGGSYIAAAEVSRELKVTDPMQRLATWMPVHGAVAGSMLGALVDGDQKATAAAVLAGSLGGTALGLWRGQGMNVDEASATLAGTDVGGLAGYGIATFAGLTDRGHANKGRLAASLGGMLIGAPLGHAYAALAPYHVTRGDLLAMTATAGVGMLAGLTVIAHEHDPTQRQVAGALTVGGLAGLVVGDRLFTRRYDHTEGDGTLMIGGGVAGGLMGAGVAVLTGGSTSRWNTTTAALTTVGAAAGLAWSQYYLAPAADGATRLGAIRFNPAGFVAAAARAQGTYTLATIRF